MPEHEHLDDPVVIEVGDGDAGDAGQSQVHRAAELPVARVLEQRELAGRGASEREVEVGVIVEVGQQQILADVDAIDDRRPPAMARSLSETTRKSCLPSGSKSPLARA